MSNIHHKLEEVRSKFGSFLSTITKGHRIPRRRSQSYFLLLFLALLCSVAEEVEVKKTAHESESETIAKCLEDLNSDAIDVRKRAVLILGKYSNPLARNGVVSSLGDRNSDIRRSALVSLTEKPVTADAAKPMLKMIGDDDVHVRRIASSYIPEILRGSGRTGLLRLSASKFDDSSKEFQTVITHAFVDDDAIVRKNMLTHFHYFRDFLSKGTLKKLLGDSDREVRVLALNASATRFQGHEFVDAISSMSSDPDTTIRKRLTEILENISDATAVETLKKLTKDEDFEISTAAFAALFKRSDLTVYPELRKRLDHPQIKRQTVTKIIRLMPTMGKQGEEALLEMIVDPELRYRRTALEVYGQSYGDKANVEILAGLMMDPSKNIRETASRIFIRLRQFEVEDINPMVTSPYPDVRKIALIVSKRIPTPDVSPLLMELILDEILDLRLLALQEIVQRQVEGWESIVELTLAEDNVEIQQKTVMLLLKKRSAKIDEILLNFAKDADNTILRHQILNGLNKGYDQPQ